MLYHGVAASLSPYLSYRGPISWSSITMNADACSAHGPYLSSYLDCERFLAVRESVALIALVRLARHEEQPWFCGQFGLVSRGKMLPPSVDGYLGLLQGRHCLLLSRGLSCNIKPRHAFRYLTRRKLDR